MTFGLVTPFSHHSDQHDLVPLKAASQSVKLTPAADALRKRKAAVARLLRRVGAVARPAPVTPPSTICSPPQPVSQLGSSSPKKPPSKAAKRSATGPNTPGKAHEANAQEDGNGKEKEKEKEKESPKKSKRKKKKKKKATLANEGNPHHIDKCECPYSLPYHLSMALRLSESTHLSTKPIPQLSQSQ